MRISDWISDVCSSDLTFAALFLNLGMEAWFSERVQTAVRDSLIVAKAYLEEHQQRVGGEALAMANDLRREGPILLTNRQRVEQVMELQSTLRSLTEAVIIDGERQILAHAGYSLMLEFDLDRSEEHTSELQSLISTSHA